MMIPNGSLLWDAGTERATTAADGRGEGQGGRGDERMLASPADLSEIRVSDREESNAWSSSFHSRSSHSTTTPRSRPGSASGSPESPHHQPFFRDFSFGSPVRGSSRLSNTSASSSSFSFSSSSSTASLVFSWLWRWKLWACLWFRFGMKQQQKTWVKRKGATKIWHHRRRVRGIAAVIGLVLLFFVVVNWWMLLHLQDSDLHYDYAGSFLNQSSSLSIRHEWSRFPKGKRPQRVMYSRLLALAAHALAEGTNKPDPKGLWDEPLITASAWTPCADRHSGGTCGGDNGYILVSANGGINQQRVAVCNAVAVSRLLNATLVLPKFLYSSVWRDNSQFSDIYQEEHFINYLKDDIRIVKELPVELQSLDLEAIGSLVTDEEIMKEAKPSFYRKKILPILLKNRVIHFIGFGNRLAFDPIPFHLQRLRCKCNYHALKFVPQIQKAGSLLVQRMRQYSPRLGPLDHHLFDSFAAGSNAKGAKKLPTNPARYLALHLRFEIDMVAHSMCEFGGSEEERKELEAYRMIHFPALVNLSKSTELPSAASLRSEGQCPLMPEEAVLMLASLGFNRKTPIFLAGAHIYGGKSRMAALTSLYPNLVTKENLLLPSELRSFMNFSSQLAALDFIGCAAADAFAMTDSGSQLSSLVSGYRIYYGGGRMPTIRPNKRRLAAIFAKNASMEWEELESRVRKTVRQSKKVLERPVARSIYRHPRCRECMCKVD